MSFHVEFTAVNPRVANKVVRQDENLPLCVQAFICQALNGCKEDKPVYVKATGHLCQGVGSSDVSTAALEVRSVHFVDK